MVLLTNHESTIAVGTPLCHSDATWAGNAARMTSHHHRPGNEQQPGKQERVGHPEQGNRTWLKRETENQSWKSDNT